MLSFWDLPLLILAPRWDVAQPSAQGPESESVTWWLFGFLGSSRRKTASKVAAALRAKGYSVYPNASRPQGSAKPQFSSTLYSLLLRTALRILVLIFLLLVARTTEVSDLTMHRANKEEAWKVREGKRREKHCALAGNRAWLSRVGSECSTSEPPMLLSVHVSDSSPESISRMTEEPVAGKQKSSKIGLPLCLWKTELTDWQAPEAKACERDSQSGNSMKWGQSNENIKISVQMKISKYQFCQLTSQLWSFHPLILF